MGSLEISLWKNVRFRSHGITKILLIQIKLQLHHQIQCWPRININCWFELIRWLNISWIQSPNGMYHPIINGPRKPMGPNWRISQRQPSNSQLGHRWCRYTNQESRTMRIMLGILNHRIIRRSPFHFNKELIIILRITISWLFNIIRKPRMWWWFNGLRFWIRWSQRYWIRSHIPIHCWRRYLPI